MIDIKINSKEVKDGDVFIALKGIKDDGHKYIEEAIDNGASKIICEKGNYSVKTVKVKNTYKYLLKYLKKNYYPLIKDIKLIGITGTCGKTTTAFLTYELLKGLEEKVAYIGTNGFYLDSLIEEMENTTPNIYEIYKLLLKCKEENIKYVVMEVSSHALEMGRVETLLFDRACFTNISSEHMDYHENMENYFNSKKKLFKKLRKEKICIINESTYSDKLLKINNKNILVKEEDIFSIKCFIDKTIFKYDFGEFVIEFNIPLVGEYNIMNYIDAILLVSSFGYDIEVLKDISIYSPKGRMEMVIYKDNSIFIDFAHKPEAVRKVLKLANEIKEGKVYTVIGCGGDRDKTKRSIMGEIAVKNSDYVIFTSDNPRTENEDAILNDIVKNLTLNNYEIFSNREMAIKKAISKLYKKDILLVLGKGHENYQIIGETKHHFSDLECVLKICS